MLSRARLTRSLDTLLGENARGTRVVGDGRAQRLAHVSEVAFVDLGLGDHLGRRRSNYAVLGVAHLFQQMRL